MTQRAVHEREEEWIAKYRASLQGAPLERSRFESLHEVARKTWAEILMYGGKIFDRAPEPKKQPQKPTISVRKIDKSLESEETKRIKAS